jgi:glycerol-3-phosphate dehydrogenase (NAD(P)+)
LSRNRGFGERLGSGEKVTAILAAMVSVAEGYPTARAAFRLARKLEISTPIIDEVYSMLYEDKDVRQAVHDVTRRDSKAED